MMIYITDMSLDSFHGLWGYYDMPVWLSVPLTVVSVVGIINATNLIDGVDGLSSGFCIMASIIFGVLFFMVGKLEMCLLCMLTIGALMPFFFHNVFGVKSKMFIGDGGALVMGVVMSTFVVNILASGSAVADYVTPSFGLIPFVLAVMSVPVIDTIRVMATRMFNGRSPFSPDKTHIHHLFIELGFSHSGTTIAILSINGLIIVAQLVAWYVGCSIDVQLYVVIALGAVIDYGMNYIVNRLSADNVVRRAMVAIGRATHFEDNTTFRLLRKFVDRSVS
jgi:UDP-N-acetylmuramyl pentapeptide phosphotransferase/UDP-N-acetylglucosamine-1-phosphate transferase